MLREQWLQYLVEKLRLRSFWGDAVLQNQTIPSHLPEAVLDPVLGILIRTCSLPVIGVKAQF